MYLVYFVVQYPAKSGYEFIIVLPVQIPHVPDAEHLVLQLAAIGANPYPMLVLQFQKYVSSV
mgnify:CR=1 FL=1